MRDITAATQAASESDNPRPVWFVKLEFDDGDLCLSTHDGPLSFGGDDYIGAGTIGAISSIDENIELARSSLQMTLRGLPTDIVAIVLAEHYQGRRATTYLGYLGSVPTWSDISETWESLDEPWESFSTPGRLIADPVIIHRGRMDNASIQQGKTCSVTLNVESRFADWNRSKARRYNNADQQARYPGDRGMEFVEQAVAGKTWGVR